MKAWSKALVCIILFFSFLVTAIGYAALTDHLSITGTVGVTPPAYDVYITHVTPTSSAGITVNNTSGTTMFSSVTGSGTATFTIDVINVSDKIYIFERVIDGAETGIEGVYAGNDIQYKLSGISMFDEIAPNGGTRSFDVTITVPRGVTADNYVLIFNFVEKTGTEILPGHDEYDITFQYNNDQPNVTIQAHVNEYIPRPETPVKTGYAFMGWYTDITYTKAWNFEVDRVSGHMTLYAGWEPVAPTDYVVTFKPNNGGQNSVVVVPAGALVPRPTMPTMEGYTFIGWYTDEACTNPWNFDTDKVNANMILYGGWEVYVPPVPPELYISFDPNTGDDEITTIIVMTGDFIPRPENPVYPGHTFIGWYVDEGLTKAWNFETDRPDSNMTLYGGWVVDEIGEQVTYTITFKPNNGAEDSVVTVEDGALIPRPELPVKEGYTFIGWYTDEKCTLGWNFDTDRPVADMTLYGGWEETTSSDQDQLHDDFLGLVEALLSDSNNCLNDNDLIFDAVMESLTSKKRPKEDAPILHCSVNSVSGGTMSAIATYANAKLTANLHFIFEVDPDPAYQDSRMRLYMYYGNACSNAQSGDKIMVYQQIVTRGADGIWYADGTYIGKATVGNYFGGGNSGKDVKTISPYTWTYGYP